RATGAVSAITTTVRLTVSREVGQATLRSSDRTSRMKLRMSAKGLPVRRPPRPAAIGIGAGALALLVATLPPRRPCPRLDAARAEFDCVLFGWATGRPFIGTTCQTTLSRWPPAFGILSRRAL